MRANYQRVELRRRLPRLLFGLVLCGVGVGLMVRAELGLGPWDVLHEGLANRTGLPMGMVLIFVGVLVLATWLPLRERPGLGTVLNVLVIGLTVDATLFLVGTPDSLALRIVMMLAGPLLFGVGSGYYIGAGLGAGPRDGIMTGLARRGWSVGVARAAIEFSALGAGWLLGGTVGVGTVVFAVSIGPIVHVVLPRLSLPDAAPRELAGDTPI